MSIQYLLIVVEIVITIIKSNVHIPPQCFTIFASCNIDGCSSSSLLFQITDVSTGSSGIYRHCIVITIVLDINISSAHGIAS